MAELQHHLVLSALLFSIGLAVVLVRRNVILILAGIELMLNAANINFIAFWYFEPRSGTDDGMLLVLFAMAVAAAEVAVGLALILAVWRRFRTLDIDRIREMKP